DWPRRVGGVLFVQTRDLEPRYLDKVDQLFAWIGGDVGMVGWETGPKFVTQGQVYQHFRASVVKYDAIEAIPHRPPIPGIYYMHPPAPEARDSGRLDELVGYFCPETPIDRQLIRAWLITPFWGGPPGKRPAFLAQGPKHDKKQGRGVGKSKLFDVS